MHAWCQNQAMYCGHFDTRRKGSHSSFLTPTVVDARRPLSSEICDQNDPLLRKTPTRYIFAYNVSTVTDSEKVQFHGLSNEL